MTLVLACHLSGQDFQTVVAAGLQGARLAASPADAGHIFLSGSAGPGFRQPCVSGAVCVPIVPRGRSDAYFAKLSSDGRRKLWERTFGGSGDDYPQSMVPTLDGGAFVTVLSQSADLPVPGAAQHPDATLIIRLAPDGSTVFTRFLDLDARYSILGAALDSSGDLLFTGWTGQLGDPLTRFTGRLHLRDRSVQLSRYAVGGYYISTDASGNVLITGSDAAGAVETTEGAFQPGAATSFCGTSFVGFPCSHQFVVKLSPDLQTRLFATYVTGSHNSGPGGPALALPDGSIALYGSTGSRDYPTTQGAWMEQYPSVWLPALRTTVRNPAGFFSILSADGGRLLYSTYIGGLGSAGVDSAVAAAGEGRFLLRGQTTQAFPGLAERTTTCGPRDERFVRGSSSLAVFPAPFEFLLDTNRASESAALLRADLPETGTSLSTAVAGGAIFALMGSGPDAGIETTPGVVAAASAAPGAPGASNQVILARRPLSRRLGPPRLACIEDPATMSVLPAGRLPMGQLVAIYAGPFAAAGEPEVFSPLAASLPRAMRGVEVRIDGEPIPLVYVSRWQINAMIPSRLQGSGGGDAALEIRIDGEPVIRQAVTLVPPEPALFLSPTGSCGSPTLLALRSPEGSQATCDNPARSGEVVSLFLNGLGAAEGQSIGDVNHDESVIGPPVALRSILGDIVFAGPAPGQPAGIWQVGIRLPAVSRGLRPVGFRLPDGREISGGIWVQE